MWRFACAVFGVVLAATPLAACIIGDPAQTPTIEVTGCPPDCCYGTYAGNITGIVNNVDTDAAAVVLYAQTNQFWVQPYDYAPWTEIQCPGGTFSNWTRGGHHYVAILAKRSWSPPATLYYLPPIGGDILAISLDYQDGTPSCPLLPKALHWKGFDWMVKSGGTTHRLDPGSNYFSDSPDHVWIDDEDRLHLRIDSTDGRWYCGEILTEQYQPYGTYTFCVESAIDLLDPKTVFAGFLYESPTNELDIEFSRCLACATNASYAVQPWGLPGNLHCYPLALPCARSCYQIVWRPAAVRFATLAPYCGDIVSHYWDYTGANIPVADIERWHFNLWLCGGAPPSAPQEVIISDFGYDPATGIETGGVPETRNELSQNVPNPFNPATTIRYSIKERSHVRLTIYGVTGALVRTLVDGMEDPAPFGHAVTWDGTNEEGKFVSSGVYFYTLTTKDFRQTKKMVRLE